MACTLKNSFSAALGFMQALRDIAKRSVEFDKAAYEILRVARSKTSRVAVELQRAGLTRDEITKLFYTGNLGILTEWEWEPYEVEKFKQILREDGLYFKK